MAFSVGIVMVHWVGKHHARQVNLPNHVPVETGNIAALPLAGYYPLHS